MNQPEGRRELLLHGAPQSRVSRADVARDLARDYAVAVGGRVTHRMALDYPEKIERAAVLDIIPTHYLFSRVDKAFAEGAYHWFLFARLAPFPDETAAVRAFLAA